MAEIWTSLEHRVEIKIPAQMEEALSKDQIKLILHFLSEINEIKKCENWTPSRADLEQKVIFKATVYGTCYTLLCSQVDPESRTEQNSLSPREQEIVRLAARGMSNKTIAAVLDISPWTVSTYIRRIFSKLNVNSRVEMVAIVTKLGVLEEHSVQHNEENPAVLEFQRLLSHLLV